MRYGMAMAKNKEYNVRETFMYSGIKGRVKGGRVRMARRSQSVGSSRSAL